MFDFFQQSSSQQNGVQNKPATADEQNPFQQRQSALLKILEDKAPINTGGCPLTGGACTNCGACSNPAQKAVVDAMAKNKVLITKEGNTIIDPRVLERLSPEQQKLLEKASGSHNPKAHDEMLKALSKIGSDNLSQLDPRAQDVLMQHAAQLLKSGGYSQTDAAAVIGKAAQQSGITDITNRLNPISTQLQQGMATSSVNTAIASNTVVIQATQPLQSNTYPQTTQSQNNSSDVIYLQRSQGNSGETTLSFQPTRAEPTTITSHPQQPQSFTSVQVQPVTNSFSGQNQHTVVSTPQQILSNALVRSNESLKASATSTQPLNPAEIKVAHTKAEIQNQVPSQSSTSLVIPNEIRVQTATTSTERVFPIQTSVTQTNTNRDPAEVFVRELWNVMKVTDTRGAAGREVKPSSPVEREEPVQLTAREVLGLRDSLERDSKASAPPDRTEQVRVIERVEVEQSRRQLQNVPETAYKDFSPVPTTKIVENVLSSRPESSTANQTNQTTPIYTQHQQATVAQQIPSQPIPTAPAATNSVSSTPTPSQTTQRTQNQDINISRVQTASVRIETSIVQTRNASVVDTTYPANLSRRTQQINTKAVATGPAVENSPKVTTEIVVVNKRLQALLDNLGRKMRELKIDVRTTNDEKVAAQNDVTATRNTIVKNSAVIEVAKLTQKTIGTLLTVMKKEMTITEVLKNLRQDLQQIDFKLKQEQQGIKSESPNSQSLLTEDQARRQHLVLEIHRFSQLLLVAQDLRAEMVASLEAWNAQMTAQDLEYLLEAGIQLSPSQMNLLKRVVKFGANAALIALLEDKLRKKAGKMSIAVAQITKETKTGKAAANSKVTSANTIAGAKFLATSQSAVGNLAMASA